VCPEGEIGRIIEWYFDVVASFEDGGMVRTIERHIVCRVPSIRHTNTFDHAHVTGENGVVTLHVHNHGDGWYISEHGDQICMQHKELIPFSIKGSDAMEEFE